MHTSLRHYNFKMSVVYIKSYYKLVYGYYMYIITYPQLAVSTMGCSIDKVKNGRMDAYTTVFVSMSTQEITSVHQGMGYVAQHSIRLC